MVKCQCGKGKCLICGIVGYIQILNKGKYARVRHYDRMLDNKPQFHYHQITIEQANEILTMDREIQTHRPIPMTHTNDQKAITNDSERKELALKSKNNWAGRLAWLGHWLYEPKVAGSSPARPTSRGIVKIEVAID